MKIKGVIVLFLFCIFASPVSASEGKEIYLNLCSGCHHPKRIGYYAPPLIPPSLRNLSDKDIEKIIREGIHSAPLKPSFPYLKDEEVKAIISYLRSKPENISWGEEEINKSRELSKNHKGALKIRDTKNLTLVVERGKNSVWVMDGEEIVDSFEANNIHGGIKFTSDGQSFFVPSRDGWISKYEIKKGGLYGKSRACVYMRNISLSRDDRYLIVSCGFPASIAILSSENLNPVKIIPLEGKIEAIYELHSRDEAIFTFRDRPLIGILNTKNLTVEYLRIDSPLEGFFIDPFEEYLIGSSKSPKALRVHSLKNGTIVFEYPLESMPHLFSISWWYNKGNFYFATPHSGGSYISIWKMYDWAFVKKIDIGGEGFLVRTNPGTPYLWCDNSSDELVLIDKRDLTVKKITPVKGKRITHTEFSGDGKIAYLSIYDSSGYILLYDGDSIREVKRIKAIYPAGKYNFVNKSRRFNLPQFGREVFMEKCWGCHHPTREAFGPSFRRIASNRNREMILSYLQSPSRMYSTFGYERTVMPEIPLNDKEMESILSFIIGSADAKDN